MDNEYIILQFRGRRKSKFKIGFYYRMVKPLDLIEVSTDIGNDLIRNHNFRPSDKKAEEAIRFFCNRPFDYSRVRDWLLNKKCFIVGRGGSLHGFDFNRLNDKIVIAINEAFLSVRSDAVVFCDRGMWKKYQKELSEYEGYIFAAERTEYYRIDRRNNVVIFPLNNYAAGTGIEDGLYCGASSGMLALNLAHCLGASEIYLLGFDLNENEKIYFDNYTQQDEKAYTDKKRNSEHIKLYKEAFCSYRNVWNCSSVSRLNIFPYKNIDEVLNATS